MEKAGGSNPIEIPATHFGITLRQFTLKDAPNIFIVVNNNRSHFSQFGDTTAEKYKTLKDVEDSILHPKNPDRLRFGIWNNRNEFVGSINLTPDKENEKQGEIGYYLSPDYIGKGYMLNSVLTLVTYAFHHLGYEKLYATTNPENMASQRVLLKAGFKETGDQDKNKLFTILKNS